MKYQLAYDEDGTAIFLQGDIDEHIGQVLSELTRQIRGPRLRFDLEKVNFVNSLGIATWIAHLPAFRQFALVYAKAPYVFVSLCRIMPQLLDGGMLLSFQVRYSCQECESKAFTLALVEREESLRAGSLPVRVCAKCKQPMPPDPADAGLYNLFVRSAPSKRSESA